MTLTKATCRLLHFTSKLKCPTIKFRHGLEHQKPTIGSASSASSRKQTPTQSNEPIYDFQLPRRFQRKPLAEEEIAVINAGGAI